jgi:hypothetical protein
LHRLLGEIARRGGECFDELADEIVVRAKVLSKRIVFAKANEQGGEGVYL